MLGVGICCWVCAAGTPTTPPAPRRPTSTGASLSPCSLSQQQQRPCQVRVGSQAAAATSSSTSSNAGMLSLCKQTVDSMAQRTLPQNCKYGQFSCRTGRLSHPANITMLAQVPPTSCRFCPFCHYCACRWPVCCMQYSHSSTVGCSMGRQGGPLWPCCGCARRCIQQGCCSCCQELAVHLVPV
jgi:hypothetical protein